MNLTVRAPLLFVCLLLGAAGMAVAGCSGLAAQQEIRARIFSIRDAILAKRAEGIVEFAAPDWRFDGPDDKSYNRESYLERAKMFLPAWEIESLETRFTQFDQQGARAEVGILQTMVRVETDASGVRTRWKIRYHEQQEWVETRPRGWLMTSVRVFKPEREPLPLR